MPTPQATFYVWIPCPKGYTSTELCTRILDEADVVTTPGLGFGRTADGYIRAALTVETPRLLEAVERIGKLGYRGQVIPGEPEPFGPRIKHG